MTDVNLSIKGVPEAMAQRLRRRAQRNHRSLQGELMAIIEQAAAEPEASPGGALASRGVEVIVRRGSKTVEQVAKELRALYPKPATHLPRSVDVVREMRDKR
jgi:plasmid stability protein